MLKRMALSPDCIASVDLETGLNSMLLVLALSPDCIISVDLETGLKSMLPVLALVLTVSHL